MTKRSRDPGLKQYIQEHIKRYITEKGLRPGDLLPPEGQFAADLGVSRGSVREAVKSLESLGLVEARHGTGVCVREFNFDSVLDFLSFGLSFQPSRAAEILQIREWLEESAVVAVTDLINEGQLTQLDYVLAVWETKARAGEMTSNEDRSFHRILYEPLQNASLLSLIDIFWVVYNNLAVRTVAGDPDPLQTVQEHREIFEAVRARNTELAKQRLSRHFRNIEQRFRIAGQTAAITTTKSE